MRATGLIALTEPRVFLFRPTHFSSLDEAGASFVIEREGRVFPADSIMESVYHGITDTLILSESGLVLPMGEDGRPEALWKWTGKRIAYMGCMNEGHALPFTRCEGHVVKCPRPTDGAWDNLNIHNVGGVR